MPDYVMLMKLTAKGAANIDDSPNRITAAKELWEGLGGTLTSFHATFGEYDFVAVGSAPDDWSAAFFAKEMARLGDVTSMTMRAINEEEWLSVLARQKDWIERKKGVLQEPGPA
jgi:uncharacterized protein with GYD domain